MKFEEIKAKWTGRKLGFCTLEIKQVNLTGTHPFCVGTVHVVYASEHNSGRLDESVLAKFPCQMKLHDGECRRELKDPVHASEIVAYVRISAPCTQKDIANDLCTVKEEATADGIYGFAFPDTQMITDWGRKAEEKET